MAENSNEDPPDLDEPEGRLTYPHIFLFVRCTFCVDIGCTSCTVIPIEQGEAPMSATAHGYRNVADRHEMVDALVLILRTPRSVVASIAKTMTNASIREWIETEMQARQAA